MEIYQWSTEPFAIAFYRKKYRFVFWLTDNNQSHLPGLFFMTQWQ